MTVLQRMISSLGPKAPQRPDGPDFLGIGMMKAATGWLYDQLQFHPDFWMPPFKEFHYFDKPFPSPPMLALARAAGADLSALNQRRLKKTERPLDGPDLDFLDRVTACAGMPPDIERYAGLFAPKGRLISGDITPAFSILDAGTVARLADRLASARVVFIVRDPVERMWSQITMTALDRTGTTEALSDLDGVRGFMRLQQVQARSRPTQILDRWRGAFGAERTGVFFFDDVAQRPETARAQILAFLGADPAMSGGAVAAGFNRKSSHPRVAMTPQIHRLLVDDLRDELQACASSFGDVGAQWLRKHEALI